MPSYHVDDATLRDEPDDHDEAWAYVRTLGASGEKVAWLRMLGELDDAEAMGWALVADAGGPGSLAAADSRVRIPMSALAPAVRLAHVLHWQGRFRDADVLFTAVVTSAEDLVRLAAGESASQQRATTMLAFALQHLGKSRFDEGRLDEALGLFERALDLRMRIGAPGDQLASSQQAVATTGARLASAERASE